MASKLIDESYDDNLSRGYVINFFEDKFGIDLISNPEMYKIDLLIVGSPHGGVEVERGKWTGDFWSSPGFCRKTNLGYDTLNVPYRKVHFWLSDDPGYLENLYVRHNLDGTQFLILRPEIITDTRKMKITEFVPGNNKHKKEETFLSYRREDVETYTLTDGGIYVLTR